MSIGVSFQPGTDGYGQGNNNNAGTPPPAGNGVQEAIKVLSLRLPKVVGAQGLSPLMTAPAMGGGRVDSIVNSVLAKMFPGSGMPQMGAESFGMAPQNAPTFGGDGMNPLLQMKRSPFPDMPGGLTPRVVGELPTNLPMDFGLGPNTNKPIATPDGGQPFTGMIGELPKKTSPFPEFPSYPAPEYTPREPDALI